MVPVETLQSMLEEPGERKGGGNTSQGEGVCTGLHGRGGDGATLQSMLEEPEGRGGVREKGADVKSGSQSVDSRRWKGWAAGTNREERSR
jgi:hypothetical protein